MITVLILGSAGMAGHVISKYLSQFKEYHVINCARNSSSAGTIILDVTDFSTVQKTIIEAKPGFVINCVGLLIEASKKRFDEAVLINSYFPHFLARIGKEQNFRLIHLSTDCIFSGKRGNYTESDTCDSNEPYARTRALGEINSADHLTIRTSFIGPELKPGGTGLFNWFMHQSGVIKGYSRAYWSGVTTIELSKFIHAAIKGNLTGLYQLTAPGKISKYDLLMLFKRIWQREDVQIEPFDGYFSDKSMISTRTDFPWRLPAYPDMFAAMKQWMDEHPALYRHYA
ncbi:MAG: SDR family oxidoreductase [Verrucomicrobiota bacterium]